MYNRRTGAFAFGGGAIENNILECKRDCILSQKGAAKIPGYQQAGYCVSPRSKDKMSFECTGILTVLESCKTARICRDADIGKKRAAVLHLWAGPGELGRRRPTDFSGVQRFLYSECLCGLLRLLYGAELQEDGQVSAEGDIPYQFMRENGYAVVGNQIILDYYHPANQYPSILNYYTVCGLYQQTLKSK